MKILFLTRAYGQHAGGMERLSYELIQHISRQPGVQANVVAHRGARATSPLFNLSALPKALAAARNADVIHLGDPILSLLGWKLKKLTGKPIAVTVHGLDITYPNFFYQLYLKLFFTKFDLYLPISSHVKKILESRFSAKSIHFGGPVLMPKGFRRANSKLHILTPGVTDRFYDPNITRDQLAELLNQDLTNKKALFTSGRLVKRKGHEWFIREVLPKLPENVIYVIAGDGPEFKRVAAAGLPGRMHGSSSDAHPVGVKLSTGPAELQARKHTDDSRVLLLGKVSNDQLKILYNTVDAFIMPNIPVENDVEGFGLVLLEAALCNRPVFAANLEGIPDAIHDGKNGTLLPPQDAVSWSAALEKFLQQPAATANTRTYTLENFSWDSAVKKYIAALQRNP